MERTVPSSTGTFGGPGSAVERSAEAVERWLLAHDLTPSSDAAAAEAARLVTQARGALVMVFVDETNHATSEEREVRASVARGRLDRLAAILRERHPALDVMVRVVRGEPVACIVDLAREIDARTVVVGSGGRSSDPLSVRLLRACPVPTLVVPEHE